MIYRREKLKYVGFVLVLVFCLVYHFVFENNTKILEYCDIRNETVNTSGYLVYIHTATFYTAFFVFLLGKIMLRTDVQYLIRASRIRLFIRNVLISFLSSVIFSICIIFPHILYMQIYYNYNELLAISFYKLTLIQILSYTLYYIVSCSILFTIYYLSLNYVLSQLMTIGFNILFMFGYRLLNIKTYIEATLVFTKYYGGLTETQIIIGFMPLVTITIILLSAAYLLLSGKDVL